MPPPCCVQEDALTTFFGNITEALELPADAISVTSLQQAGNPTGGLAVSSAPSGGSRRLLVTSSSGGAKLSSAPLYLMATFSIPPSAAADAGGQFSASWMQAALEQASADQPDNDPVQLTGVDGVARWGHACMAGVV